MRISDGYKVIEGTTGECLHVILARASDYGDGRLEELENKFNKLTDIVVAMLDHAAPVYAKKVIEAVSHFKVVEN